MISARNDYDFVTIDEPLLVNGEVMPLREETGVLRAEDPAFCLEGACERAVVAGTQYPAGDSLNVDKVVSGTRWRNTIETLEGAAHRALKKDFVFTGKILGGFGWIDPSVTYSGCAYDVSSMKSDADLFRGGEPLKAQPVMDVFDDLDSLRRFWDRRSPARTSNSFNLSVDDPYGILHRHPSAQGVTIYDAVLQKGGPSGIQAARAVADANIGSLRVRYSDAPRLRRLTFVLSMRCYYVKYSATGPRTKEDYFSVCIDSTGGEGDDYDVPMANVVSSALAFCDNNIRIRPTLDGIGPNETVDWSIEFSPNSGIEVLELGDHTDWKAEQAQSE